MPEPFRRDHFLLALFAGALAFFVVGPLAMATVLGDAIHVHDKRLLALIDFAGSLLVVFVIHGTCQRWWRGEPTRVRWRRVATALLALLVAPLLGLGVLFLVGYALVLALA